MSRRRSQTQKENRERTVNSRRQLENLPELELSSMDASIAMANMSVVQEKAGNNSKPAKSETPIHTEIKIKSPKCFVYSPLRSGVC